MTQKDRNQPHNWQKLVFLAAAILVAASIGVQAASAVKVYIDHPTRDFYAAYDVDWQYLNCGLDRVKSFADTASWWTGTWCGVVPFWRPLTSYAFWGMRLIWPPEYLLPRQLISVFLHLCFVALAGLFLLRITRRPWLVLLALWLFAGARPFPLDCFSAGTTAVGDLLSDPKNIPDSLSGMCMLLSLMLLAGGKWPTSLAAAAASVGFKEIGFTTWPLALLLLAWINADRIMAERSKYAIGSVKRNRLPIAIWLLAFGLLGLIHFLTVGIGYRVGTNEFWYRRAIAYFGGPVGNNLFSINMAAPVTAILLVTVFAGFRRLSPIPKLIGAVAALALGVLLDTFILHTTWEISTVRMLAPELNLDVVVICIAWLLIARQAIRNWQTAASGIAMCIVASIPSWLATQTLEHTRYLASFFMEIAVATALLESAEAIARVLSPKRLLLR